MIRLSVDTLWLSQTLLRRISDYVIYKPEDIYIKNLSLARVNILMELALTCCWIIKKKNIYSLSERGKMLLDTEDFSNRARIMLYDYICYVAPAWAKRIPYGRLEAFIFMTKDEQACFYEAGLMEDSPEDAVVSWWDHISCRLRKAEDDMKTKIGRRGEYLTIHYEQERTGEKPCWVSLDSNLSGYDVISQCGQNDASRLLIEVKSSEKSIVTADFFVSENEWHTASNAKNYLFYLWSFFENRRRLAIISPQQLSCYIPTNNKSGKWQTVKIPFADFSEAFKEVV